MGYQVSHVIVGLHREQARSYRWGLGIVRFFLRPSYHELFNFP